MTGNNLVLFLVFVSRLEQVWGTNKKEREKRERDRGGEREREFEFEFEFEFIFILQRLQIRQDASFHLAVNTEL